MINRLKKDRKAQDLPVKFSFNWMEAKTPTPINKNQIEKRKAVFWLNNKVTKS
jgi:hypothetical protein